MKTKKVTVTAVAKHLREGMGFDSVSISKGIVTVRRGFFYRHGGTAEGFTAKVLEAVREEFPRTEFEVVDSGEVWKPFKGGASTANQSHWFVKMKLAEEKIDPAAPGSSNKRSSRT